MTGGMAYTSSHTNISNDSVEPNVMKPRTSYQTRGGLTGAGIDFLFSLIWICGGYFGERSITICQVWFSFFTQILDYMYITMNKCITCNSLLVIFKIAVEKSIQGGTAFMWSQYHIPSTVANFCTSARRPEMPFDTIDWSAIYSIHVPPGTNVQSKLSLRPLS